MEALQLDLLDSPPAVISQVPGGYRALALAELHRNPADHDPVFVSWLHKNWPLWTRFCRLADEVRARRSNYSARAIFHAIRLETVLRENPVVDGRVPMLKLNNRWSASCARLYNALSTSRSGFFHTRESCP